MNNQINERLSFQPPMGYFEPLWLLEFTLTLTLLLLCQGCRASQGDGNARDPTLSSRLPGFNMPLKGYPKGAVFIVVVGGNQRPRPS